jgi:hypothetical protein
LALLFHGFKDSSSDSPSRIKLFILLAWARKWNFHDAIATFYNVQFNRQGVHATKRYAPVSKVYRNPTSKQWVLNRHGRNHTIEQHERRGSSALTAL